MTTTEQVDESLKVQTERHRVLKEIILILAKLRKDDEEGAEWVIEQFTE